MVKKHIQIDKSIEIAKIEGAIAILEKIGSKSKSDAFSDVLSGSSMLGYNYCLQEFKDYIDKEIIILKNEMQNLR
jgi:hypothetical protein